MQYRVEAIEGEWLISRITSIYEYDALVSRLGGDLPGILDIRRETVEHPFGSIKQWINQDAFLMRGLDKVRAEFSLTALAYNFRWAMNLVGVQGADPGRAGLI